MQVGEIDWAGLWDDIKRNAGELFSVDYVKERVRKLKDIGVEFDETYKKLESWRPLAQKDPIANASYYKLLKTGDEIRLQITKAISSIRSVYDWILKNTGVALGDLAAVPLIPIAIVGAILAAILAAEGWIKDAKVEMARLQSIQQVIKNAPPEQQAELAKKLLAKEVAPSAIVSMTGLVQWVVIGVAVLWLAPKFLKK